MLATCGCAAISASRAERTIRLARDRNREHSPLIDLHVDLFESGVAHELVHLSSRAPAHNPALTFAIRQGVGDKLQLRMPRLIGVNEITAGLDRIS